MMDGYDGRDGSPLEQVDTQVRRWLRSVRLSVIAIVLEAIRDELESRTRAVAHGTSASQRWPADWPAKRRTGWAARS